MAMPLRTTPSEASCGVVTMTPPSSGTVWQRESCASPVPGGKIHEQIIQVAPVHGMNELLDGLHDHRPAPDDGLIAVDQEAHAHQLHAVVCGRNQLFIGADRRALLDAHHQRNARPVDVAIEQADARAEMLERAGEVHRAGGFADAAFAAGDGDDAFDAGNFVRLRHPAWVTAPAAAQVDSPAPKPFARLAISQHLLGVRFYLLRRVVVRGRELNRDIDRAVVRRDVLHDPERNDVARVAGIFHRLEGVGDLLF